MKPGTSFLAAGRLLTFALAVLATRAQTAEAQAATTIDEYQLQLVQRMPPTWYRVPRGGQVMRELLVQRCKDSAPRDIERIIDTFLEMNGGGDSERRVPEGTLIAIPYCYKSISYSSVVVKPGDTIARILGNRSIPSTPDVWRSTFELNRAELYSDEAMKRFSTTLQVGSTLHIPQAVFPFHPVSAGVQDFLQPAPPPSLPTPQPEYVRFVSAEDAGLHGCHSAGSPLVPFDGQELRKHVERQRAIARRYFGQLTPVVVGLIDSGISGVNQGVFHANRLAPNVYEKHGVAGQDDDFPKNGFIDDVYGMNLNGGPDAGAIRFYANDRDHNHGTLIGTLVLGGLEWSGQMAGDTRLRVVNFSSNDASGPMDAEKLGRAIYYLADNGARVINMSLTTGEPVESMLNAIRTSRQTLFVAAAGNNKAGGRDLADNPSYPALAGGSNPQSNVLTVGAYDTTLGVAGFSNYSSSKVDILAPGCMVPTQDVSGTMTLENGTSVAAALASFAASLVASLGESRPVAIKSRLLMSVDPDERLRTKVYGSGRLNILKVVNLYSDVIQLRDSPATIRTGRLADATYLGRFCDDPNQRSQLGSFQKVWPNIESGGRTYIEYWRINQGLISRTRCTQKDSDLSIGEVEIEGARVPGPLLGDVADIVLADYRHFDQALD